MEGSRREEIYNVCCYPGLGRDLMTVSAGYSDLVSPLHPRWQRNNSAPRFIGARFSCSCDSTAVVIEYCRQRSLHFSVYAGIKRPLFEVADNSSPL